MKIVTYDTRPDIITITETDPKHWVLVIIDSNFSLNGYDCFRTKHENGRRIIIYHPKNLTVTKIDLYNEQIESLWILFKPKNKDNLLLGCIYRNPSTNIYSTYNTCKLIENASNRGYSHICILGDFNYRDINWSLQEVCGREDNPANLFLECIKDNFLTQHITKPTRYREYVSPSILDLVLTNEENMIDKTEYLPGLGKSDHVILMFNFMLYIKTIESYNQEKILKR